MKMGTTSEFLEAIKTGDFDKVRALLEKDTGLLYTKSEEGVSPLLLAVYYNEPEIAELLATRKAVLNIFEASALGKLEIVKRLVEEQPRLVNAFADDGFQPLGLSCFFGHPGMAEYLLSRDAEVNSASKNLQKVMPLHSAVASQQLEISKALLTNGAEVNARQEGDYTPLHEAAQNGQLEMVRLLLSYDADLNPRNVDGKTPLAIAMEKGHAEVAKLLVQHGGTK